MAKTKTDAELKAEAEAKAAAEAKAKEEAEAKAKREEAAEQAAKEKAEAEAKAAAEAKAKEPAPFTVADGKSIACKRGVIGPGEEIKAKWLPPTNEKDDGTKTLANLVKKGLVKKN